MIIEAEALKLDTPNFSQQAACNYRFRATPMPRRSYHGHGPQVLVSSSTHSIIKWSQCRMHLGLAWIPARLTLHLKVRAALISCYSRWVCISVCEILAK